MNKNLKPLGLVAAVAAASAGYSGVTQAQTFAGTGLGDAAIVPYYTVQGDFVTGVHITNTSELTQIVKLRYRRASDSMDALDFNIIMSPYDMWTGSIRQIDGAISVGTSDNSCTAPGLIGGEAPMGDIFREGAEEGYVEIIGMGSVPAGSALAVAADHGKVGVPLDCAAAETNFFRNSRDMANGDYTKRGVLAGDLTHQDCSDAVISAQAKNPTVTCLVPTPTSVIPNAWSDTGNVLNVTYFIRSQGSGTEIGGRAVHLADHTNGGQASNQEIFVNGTTDQYSFLYPDLDGGNPGDIAGTSGLGGSVVGTRGRYAGVRTALGAETVVNEWSNNPANGVSTDWVVTLPGQYLQLNLPVYLDSLEVGGRPCLDEVSASSANGATPQPQPLFNECDARDLPVVLDIDFWDREEQSVRSPDGGLVISPATTDRPDSALLPNEVNVIEWTDGTNAPVLDSAYATSFNTAALGSPFGWAQLSVTSDVLASQTKLNAKLADYAAINRALPAIPPGNRLPGTTALPTVLDATAVPIVGFAAWERKFANNPAASYGRLIDHAYELAAASSAP